MGRRVWGQAVVVLWAELEQPITEVNRIAYVEGSALRGWFLTRPQRLSAHEVDNSPGRSASSSRIAIAVEEDIRGVTTMMPPDPLGSMRVRFPGYFAPDVEQRRRAYTQGLVVPDTNVLLDLYRFRSEARAQLLDALQLVDERLFIPHRVAQEFLGSRMAAIRNRADEAKAVTRDLNSGRDSAVSALQAAQSMMALPADEVSALLATIKSAFGEVHERLRALLDDKGVVSPGQPDEQDQVLGKVEQLVAGKIGPALTADEMEEARSQAVTRFERRIPPGFEDRDKNPEHAIGDYELWLQILAEAARRRLPVLLITSDTKKDWVRRDGRGIAVGPHHLLVEELRDKTGVPLIWADPTTFLREARDFLSAPVSEDTLEESRHFREEELSAELSRHALLLARDAHAVRADITALDAIVADPEVPLREKQAALERRHSQLIALSAIVSSMAEVEDRGLLPMISQEALQALRRQLSVPEVDFLWPQPLINIHPEPLINIHPVWDDREDDDGKGEDEPP